MLIVRRYLNILKQQPRPLKFLASRVLWRTGACSLFTISKDGYRLKFHPTALSASLWIDPRRRASDELFFRRCLRSGDRLVDVGANIGELTLAGASLVGPNGKVYSFEPDPRTYGYLSANVALNGFSNIDLFNLAVGNMESEITFANAGREDDLYHVSDNGEGIVVKMRKLDHLLAADSEIRLLKIDVEGYERFVLEGATEALDRTFCVYFESWESHFQRYGYACRDVISLLSQRRFKVMRFTSSDSVALVGSDCDSRMLENLVASRDVDEFLRATRLELDA